MLASLADILTVFAACSAVNTLILDLLCRVVAKVAVVPIEVRLAIACGVLTGGYLILLPADTGPDLLLIFLGSIVAGALFIWSLYRRAKRRVLERRQKEM